MGQATAVLFKAFVTVVPALAGTAAHLYVSIPRTASGALAGPARAG
jgi:hypothetical protein